MVSGATIFGLRLTEYDPMVVAAGSLLFGGLLVPGHQLPGLLGALASLLPTAALADTLRSVQADRGTAVLTGIGFEKTAVLKT